MALSLQSSFKCILDSKPLIKRLLHEGLRGGGLGFVLYGALQLKLESKAAKLGLESKAPIWIYELKHGHYKRIAA